MTSKERQIIKQIEKLLQQINLTTDEQLRIEFPANVDGSKEFNQANEQVRKMRLIDENWLDMEIYFNENWLANYEKVNDIDGIRACEIWIEALKKVKEQLA